MEKPKVLIIGATGMLGHITFMHLKKLDKYQLFNSVYRTKLTKDSIICNVRNEKELSSLFSKVRPSIVINCVGALVNESKENPTNAIYLNALLPHKLKDFCNQYQAKLIHISTDCVFSGKDGSYTEEDFRDADDVYGRSKALGEITEMPHCTLRTSIVGPELKQKGTGLFHWFINQKDQVQGFTNALWSGVTTLELAKAIDKVIVNNLIGLYHVTNGEPISKFDLLRLFNELRGNKIKIVPNNEFKINKTLKKSNKFDFKVLDYNSMLQEMNIINYAGS
jgi:dTDP-4-dehydrorhamnose reductase